MMLRRQARLPCLAPDNVSPVEGIEKWVFSKVRSYACWLEITWYTGSWNHMEGRLFSVYRLLSSPRITVPQLTLSKPTDNASLSD
jgi:hypothetical protein